MFHNISVLEISVRPVTAGHVVLEQRRDSATYCFRFHSCFAEVCLYTHVTSREVGEILKYSRFRPGMILEMYFNQRMENTSDL